MRIPAILIRLYNRIMFKLHLGLFSVPSIRSGLGLAKKIYPNYIVYSIIYQYASDIDMPENMLGLYRPWNSQASKLSERLIKANRILIKKELINSDDYFIDFILIHEISHACEIYSLYNDVYQSKNAFLRHTPFNKHIPDNNISVEDYMNDRWFKPMMTRNPHYVEMVFTVFGGILSIKNGSELMAIIMELYAIQTMGYLSTIDKESCRCSSDMVKAFLDNDTYSALTKRYAEKWLKSIPLFNRIIKINIFINLIPMIIIFLLIALLIKCL